MLWSRLQQVQRFNTYFNICCSICKYWTDQSTLTTDEHFQLNNPISVIFVYSWLIYANTDHNNFSDQEVNWEFTWTLKSQRTVVVTRTHTTRFYYFIISVHLAPTFLFFIFFISFLSINWKPRKKKAADTKQSIRHKRRREENSIKS